ncbi:MAG: hypothetical protein COU31_04200, partial [Candidatus Magasanikbacteria bacterium CG10_big_fil_rev_8_21_14_0_10_40_10]
ATGAAVEVAVGAAVGAAIRAVAGATVGLVCFSSVIFYLGDLYLLYTNVYQQKNPSNTGIFLVEMRRN